MKKRRLINCPICQQKGKINFLGEIVEDGFVVERYKNQFTIGNKNILRRKRGTTKIIAIEFIVICGQCKESIYFRRKRANLTTRFNWFYRPEHKRTVERQVSVNHAN